MPCLSMRWAALFACAFACPVQATSVDVFAYPAEDEGVNLVLLADGKEVCAITIAHPAKAVRDTPACHFEWPPSVAKLTVRGSYEGTHWRTGKRYRHQGEQSWPLVDFGPVAARLKPAGKPYGDRLADFIKAANAFARERIGQGHELARAGKPASDAEIAAAEKRLGYALPREFVSMLRTLGSVTLNADNAVIGVDQIDDAGTQMRKVWGTPDEAMKADYSEKQRANLRASTLLFSEAGDGYGGLRYRPAPTETCGDKPFYQWISQEGGDAKLLHADRRCMDFAEAFRWLIDGFLIDAYADDLRAKEGALLVDTSLDSMPLVLQTEPDRFGISLTVRWQGPNGLWRSPEAR